MSSTLKMENGDLFLDRQTGKPKVITGAEKCAQDLGSCLLTLLVPERDSRSYQAFRRDFGSELPYIKAPIQYSGFIGGPLISKKIEEAVSRLQTMQRQDPNSTSDERIKSISQLSVEQRNTTDFVFYLEVMLESGNSIDLQNLTPHSMDHLLIRTGFRDSRLPKRLN